MAVHDRRTPRASPFRINASPTRKPSKPKDRNSIISSRVESPLSAIRSEPVRFLAASERETSRETSNVCRLRLFIPTRFACMEFSWESINDFDVDAVLLDAHSKEGYGGTGEVFDWQLAAMVRRRTSKLYLAGGLSEFNVAEAIARVNPYCVDVCSLLESEPGVKDETKLRNFLVAVGKSS